MRSTRQTAIAAALASLLGAESASAVDLFLLGKKLLAVDTGRRNRLVLVVRDGALAVPTGADDPTIAGMTFHVINPVSMESTTFVLPAEQWRSNRSRTIYRYRNRDTARPALVKSAVILNRKMMKFVADSTAITLDEPAQGSLGVIITAGATRYCVLFPPTSVKKDEPCRFLARNSVAPVACPGELP